MNLSGFRAGICVQFFIKRKHIWKYKKLISQIKSTSNQVNSIKYNIINRKFRINNYEAPRIGTTS